MNGVHKPKMPCEKCLHDSETRKETKGYVLIYCPHNQAGLITSGGEEGQHLDVVISPVDEKQFKKTVVSVLLNSVLRENREIDQIFDACEIKGKLGSA